MVGGRGRRCSLTETAGRTPRCVAPRHHTDLYTVTASLQQHGCAVHLHGAVTAAARPRCRAPSRVSRPSRRRGVRAGVPVRGAVVGFTGIAYFFASHTRPDPHRRQDSGQEVRSPHGPGPGPQLEAQLHILSCTHTAELIRVSLNRSPFVSGYDTALFDVDRRYSIHTSHDRRVDASRRHIHTPRCNRKSANAPPRQAKLNFKCFSPDTGAHYAKRRVSSVLSV